MTLNRRTLLKAGGLVLAGLSLPATARAASSLATIDLRSDIDGAAVWFDPIGLLIDPGTTVRWVIKENVHTTTAYHPSNANHSLRIPRTATPWDSGYLVNPGDGFEVTLTAPGVYDYYCAPHERGGMVGRIIVGEPTGPGARPFDYFTALDPAPAWDHVPQAARDNFPPIERILADRIVRRETV